MNKVQILKDMLMVINSKIEMERDVQSKAFSLTSGDYTESLERELKLLEQKKEVLNSLSEELLAELNKK